MNGSGPRLIGPYLLCDEIACGGMATVHLARLFREGFSRIVAVKRLHHKLRETRILTTCFSMKRDYVEDSPSQRHRPARRRSGRPRALHGDGTRVWRFGGPPGKNDEWTDSHLDYRGISIQTLLGFHAAHEATDAYGQPPDRAP